MFQQLFTIAQNTFTESIRQPIFVVLILVGALLMVLNPSLAAYSMETGGGDNKMLIDLGLSSIFVVSLLLAAFTATGVLSSEVENRTVLTVVSKPVPRPVFVIGKYLGVAGAIAVAYYLLALLFLLTVRHRVMSTAADEFDGPVITFGLLAGLGALGFAAWGNYLYRWVFTSTFVGALLVTLTAAFALVLVIGKGWVFQSPVHDFLERDGEMLQLSVGLVFVFQAVLVLTAVAIAASTRLGQIMTLLVCFGVFVLGLVSHSLSQMVDRRVGVPSGTGYWQSLAAVFTANEPLHIQAVYAVTKLGALVIPNLQFLWPADPITQGNSLIHNTAGQFDLTHLGSVSAYTVLLTIAIVCFAITLFQTREVG
jgi:ABC-2 type transport system permease protein